MGVLELEPISERALFGPLPGWSLQTVVTWILSEGRLIAQPTRLVEGLIQALRSAGAPIDRFTLGVGTLHPHIAACSVRCHAKTAPVDYALLDRLVCMPDTYHR